MVIFIILLFFFFQFYDFMRTNQNEKKNIVIECLQSCFTNKWIKSKTKSNFIFCTPNNFEFFLCIAFIVSIVYQQNSQFQIIIKLKNIMGIIDFWVSVILHIQQRSFCSVLCFCGAMQLFAALVTAVGPFQMCGHRYVNWY